MSHNSPEMFEFQSVHIGNSDYSGQSGETGVKFIYKINILYTSEQNT